VTPILIVRKLYSRLSRGLAPIKPHLRSANVICFHGGRVGSTVLGNQLNQHPRISWRGEVFWADAKRRSEATDHHTFVPIDDPKRVLRRESHRAAMRIFGAEIKYTDLEMYDFPLPQLLPWLKRNAITHFIVQRRRNVLRQFVSGSIVARSKRWRQLQDQSPTLTRFHLDPIAADRFGNTLREALDKSIQLDEDARMHLEGERLLELTYEEDIEADPRIGYHKACDFLGVERAPVIINDSRMNPYQLSEILENFEEIARYLEDTPYAWMVHS